MIDGISLLRILVAFLCFSLIKCQFSVKPFELPTFREVKNNSNVELRSELFVALRQQFEC